MESLMSAVVADRMGGDRHNPNVELIAQGIANVVSPMFGGLPATERSGWPPPGIGEPCPSLRTNRLKA
jgi:hypothetical protein